jgi:hypothetical protein
MISVNESGSALTEPQSKRRVLEGDESSESPGIDYDAWRSHILSRYGIPLGPRGIRILHARLHCGLGLFDKNDQIAIDSPACAVKAVCQAIVSMNKKGDLLGKVTDKEASFASVGLDRGALKPHKICNHCVQSYCPIWEVARCRL